jgi:hypothetical protein
MGNTTAIATSSSMTKKDSYVAQEMAFGFWVVILNTCAPLEHLSWTLGFRTYVCVIL